MGTSERPCWTSLRDVLARYPQFAVEMVEFLSRQVAEFEELHARMIAHLETSHKEYERLKSAQTMTLAEFNELKADKERLESLAPGGQDLAAARQEWEAERRELQAELDRVRTQLDAAAAGQPGDESELQQALRREKENALEARRVADEALVRAGQFRDELEQAQAELKTLRNSPDAAAAAAGGDQADWASELRLLRNALEAHYDLSGEGAEGPGQATPDEGPSRKSRPKSRPKTKRQAGNPVLEAVAAQFEMFQGKSGKKEPVEK